MPASLDPALPEQRITEAAYRLPPGGAVTGWAALLLAGAAYFDGRGRDGRTPQPVPLAAGTGRGHRTNPALTWTYEPFTADEVVQLGPNPVLWPRRALFDEMRRVADWRQAVVAMDMAAAAKVVSVRRLETYAAAHGRYRRSHLVREAIPYASERSRSPKESELRLVWVLDARLPAPAVNQPIYDAAGRLICIADLFEFHESLDERLDRLEWRSQELWRTHGQRLLPW